MMVPYCSNQRSRGSVSDFEPAPSDKADLDMISCRASDAVVNSSSSTSLLPETGVRRLINSGMRGVISLGSNELDHSSRTHRL